MARPIFDREVIAPKTSGWDARVDANFESLADMTVLKPFAPLLVYNSILSDDALPLADFPAADYKFCYCHLVDPAVVGTNGYLIYSDGTNWKYAKSNSNV